ncbi:hypothetical protein CONLIGDRAFT_679588 [Coniochaeta ligniaria NRRL 30616]|uniref:Uncharacterized protein n=1 Tax=Coniochaeta ligniaria NRRL 30616 TaxID=1408157 RepID=A0A1J7JBZ7_9PEZI|nr:hypothetical protein CONLIGDRAFT_679588 [Coniochaeta ligniaria NRRL 30616]
MPSFPSAESIALPPIRVVDPSNENFALPPIRVVDPSNENRTYFFHELSEAFALIQTMSWTDCVLVRNLSPENCDEMRELAHGRQPLRLIYYPDTRELVVLLPMNGPELEGRFARWFAHDGERGAQTRTHRAPRNLLSEREYGERSHVETRGARHRHPSDRWPLSCVIIEAGVHYPLNLMRERAKWWINYSRGAIKVLIVKVDKEAGAVRIEWRRASLWCQRRTMLMDLDRHTEWSGDDNGGDWGQKTKILTDLDRYTEQFGESSNGATYSESDLEQLAGCCEVVSEAQELTLSFQELFGRPNGEHEAESLVIGADALKASAAYCWLEASGKRWDGQASGTVEDQGSDGTAQSTDTPVGQLPVAWWKERGGRGFWHR